MPTRKIRDLKPMDICNHPEHNPPGLISLPPGVYEHTCPRCNRKQTFIVNHDSRLEYRGYPKWESAD